ncbi:hypothetical protein L336_0580 [Candidatus Saccharimonas aalborgensis]|jgi:hypothetical protein|uniref:Uncharacterized protein n=1 Tax=Candidatus Saccharimonas aalborgensis TaxID=1332188 RepID=R4PL38_9BACT|nr:hypothetical protein [Candidatus Saccharimonas aalborgensis]MBP7760779.1 hypothetical protein [Candidatus Saccharibacteria bacterium]AGL62283.1 hypothetical protein L336_0580 [Candidatus Saccharimonas aalborgensis]QQR51038.1 MAG: hypothetical protein IPF89_04725 [Candidatus Saccharibacteria bacterium]QQS68786.1 MAG: hypothetical protein IPP24_02045 [Candidatus Saccharibacteria bacterium]QQS71072.1 MAG: hypothetical protein IPP92_02180 [Candidatus Saccharibacteria bacterium]
MTHELPKHQVEEGSFHMLEIVVAEGRSLNTPFSSFPLGRPFTLRFEDRERTEFPEGTMVTHYGMRAILLACLNTPEISVSVDKQGGATVSPRS